MLSHTSCLTLNHILYVQLSQKEAGASQLLILWQRTRAVRFNDVNHQRTRPAINKIIIPEKNKEQTLSLTQIITPGSSAWMLMRLLWALTVHQPQLSQVLINLRWPRGVAPKTGTQGLAFSINYNTNEFRINAGTDSVTTVSICAALAHYRIMIPGTDSNRD